MSHAEQFLQSSQLADLIVSRLIHEVVGPVGAISNGLELMEELGDAAGTDAIKLVTNSAKEAGARLQFYRMAYGRSGLTVTSQAQLRATGMAFMDNAPRHDLSWPLPPVLPSLSDGMGRVILILIEIAKECLPRGGLVKVLVEEGAVAVSAEGEVAQLPSDLADVISGTFALDTITPQTVHGALVQAFIQALGGSISIETTPVSVHLTAQAGDQ